MAIFPTQKQQQEQALRENLYVAKWCLDFNKKTSPDFKDTKDACLGYPAFILLASIIDTMGSFFNDKKTKIVIDPKPKPPRPITNAREHFFIFNHPQLFNLGLSRKTIDDFYLAFRSPMTHNNSLPKNRFLRNDSTDEKIFHLDDRNEKIMAINLFQLFKVTEKALVYALDLLRNDTFSGEQELTKRLSGQAIPFSSTWVIPKDNKFVGTGYMLEEVEPFENVAPAAASGFGANQPVDTYTVSEGKVTEIKESFFDLNKDEEL